MTHVRILRLLVLLMMVMTLAFSTPAAADTNLVAGSQAQVINTNGDGLPIYNQPSIHGATLKTLDEGWRVTIVSGLITDRDGLAWYRISHTDTTGFALADNLAAVTGTAGGLQAGETAQVVTSNGTSLRLRESPDGPVIMTLPHGAQVQVVEGPASTSDGQHWYNVNYENQAGWANGAYLQPAVQAATQRETTSRSGSRPAAEASAPAAPPAPRGGAAMAALAQRYIGSRYAYGGSSPAGFDCSGFVRYIALQALGISLGRDTYAQAGAGVPVSANQLQPGDLVFFQNTYRWGISHVGIYIGGGMMVSAANERTGVGVQGVWDGYWGPRFHSARRIA